MAQAAIRVDGGDGVGNLAARAAAWIEPVDGLQLCQRRFKTMQMRALPLRGFVRRQAKCFECGKDVAIGAGHIALEVDVFNAHQPRAAVHAGIKPACQRSDQ